MDDLQINTKLNELKLEWDSSEACKRKLDEFEHKKEERLRQREAFDQQIYDYQAQIAELNKKVAKVEAQKKSLEMVEGIPAQEAVDNEVLKGISHGERALKIEVDIKYLRGKKVSLDNRISHEITSFEDFKSRFPI